MVRVLAQTYKLDIFCWFSVYFTEKEIVILAYVMKNIIYVSF